MKPRIRCCRWLFLPWLISLQKAYPYLLKQLDDSYRLARNPKQCRRGRGGPSRGVTTRSRWAAFGSRNPDPIIEALSRSTSQSLGRTVNLSWDAAGSLARGGGGAATMVVVDSETNERFFVKTGSGALPMLQAEYLGVQEIRTTQAIRVPKPIAIGVVSGSNQGFAVYEYLRFTRGGSQFELGQNVARMHRFTSEDGFGFHFNNTIGSTHQSNPWTANWADFWVRQRLRPMLKLTDDAGLSEADAEALVVKTRALVAHNPCPSLLHGDLWDGNKGFVKENDGRISPCVFDPAPYYGDREADIAMTYLFGGFTSDFYDGYNAEYPLEKGHDYRRIVYNLYHILNHEVLFGGMFVRKAQGMIEQIMKL